MSESEEPKRPKPSRKAEEPLPRHWKVGESPDSAPGQLASEEAGKKAPTGADAAPPKSPSKAKRAAQSKKQAARDWFDSRAPGGKKVLVEETPKLDTYESRQRARLMVGGLSIVSVVALVWTMYRTFLYDPMPSNVPVDDSPVSQGTPEARLDRDQEARFLFGRAHESAKQGRAEEAIAMLTKVVTVYRGTPTAADAQEALDRPKKNLPLFTDSPAVVADAPKDEARPEPPEPTAVVKAEPARPKVAQGEVRLVLPSNPAEAVVAPPGLRDRASAAKTGVTPRALPAGFKPQPELGVDESGWPIMIVGERDGAPLVLVPGGTFMMGSNDSQVESPPHQVKLSPYYIDQHEVTNRQFRRFLAESQHRGEPPGKWLTDAKARAEPEGMPTVNVNFKDAEAYAAWAAKQLPTEAQWEMAGRSSDSRRFPWGDQAPQWSQPRASGQIDPVMAFPEDNSPYGAFDMAGNVEEWTRDFFSARYFRQLAKSVAENPTGPVPRTQAPQRVVKGGAKNFSLSYRQGIPPQRRDAHLGFRCVLVVEGAAAGPATAGAPGAPPRGAPPANVPPVSNVPF
jgi:formylglycine-generating enzyme required for sulfatase activity